jgi:transposase
MFLVRVRGMVKNRIGALLAQHSLEKPEVSDLYGKAGLQRLRGVQLPEPDGALLDEEIRLLEVLGERIAASEGLLKELAAGNEAVGWLRSLLGIGAFFSVLIRYEVEDLSRFREAKVRRRPRPPS